eukprot:m.416065 g.416065  ORF g.416065 m.416065 type:complete len:90 (-) comp29819_c0_seq1:267-536(-)
MYHIATVLGVLGMATVAYGHALTGRHLLFFTEDGAKGVGVLVAVCIVTILLCTYFFWLVYRCATLGKRKSANNKRRKENERAKKAALLG